MVAADSVLVGTVTRMTSALWIAKRAVARGGVEDTFFSKGDAVAFVQQSCSTECIESLVASEPDVYEYTIRSYACPDITDVTDGGTTITVTGTNIDSFQNATVLEDTGASSTYTRTQIMESLSGVLTSTSLVFDYVTASAIESVTLSNSICSSTGTPAFVPPIEV